MNINIISSSAPDKLFILSVHATNNKWIEVSEEAINECTYTRHLPFLLMAISADEAKNRARELFKDHFPEDDDWEVSVVAAEIKIEANLTNVGSTKPNFKGNIIAAPDGEGGIFITVQG